MATGLVEIDGSQYYFYDNGIQAKDTVYAESEDVYYVMDKTDHCVVDIVDGDDWREYRQDADEDSWRSTMSGQRTMRRSRAARSIQT